MFEYESYKLLSELINNYIKDIEENYDCGDGSSNEIISTEISAEAVRDKLVSMIKYVKECYRDD